MMCVTKLKQYVIDNIAPLVASGTSLTDFALEHVYNDQVALAIWKDHQNEIYDICANDWSYFSEDGEINISYLEVSMQIIKAKNLESLQTNYICDLVNCAIKNICEDLEA